jgi:hypothetical protein
MSLKVFEIRKTDEEWLLELERECKRELRICG